MSAEHTFFLESGNLALDLLNTAQAFDRDGGEALRSPADLRSWLAQVGLGPAGSATADRLRSAPASRRLLSEARGLRGDISRLSRALRTGERVPAHVLYGIDRVLRAGGRSTALVADGGRLRLVESEIGDSLLAVLAPVARAAAELAVSAEPDRIRRCASERCARWFVDTSRGGRRKWCSMAICGNRAKAAGYRKRRDEA